MSQALVATARITIPYGITGADHKIHAYIRGLTAVGGTWNHNSRTVDANDQVWTESAEGLWESFSYLQGSDCGPGQVFLEELLGVIWVVRAAYTILGAGHVTGSHAAGWQSTLVCRDANFKFVRVQVEEPNQSALTKSRTVPGSGATQSFCKQWTSANTVAHAPYIWQVGRSNQYLNTSAFVGYSQMTNRKIARRRGV